MKRTPVARRAPDTEARNADIYVLGGGAVGAAVARRLLADGHAVALIDDTVEPPDVPTLRADPADVWSLAGAGLETATAVIVASPSDGRNLLAAQLVKARFGVDRIVVLTNEPGRTAMMADGGLDPVCATSAIADALVAGL